MLRASCASRTFLHRFYSFYLPPWMTSLPEGVVKMVLVVEAESICVAIDAWRVLLPLGCVIIIIIIIIKVAANDLVAPTALLEAINRFKWPPPVAPVCVY